MEQADDFYTHLESWHPVDYRETVHRSPRGRRWLVVSLARRLDVRVSIEVAMPLLLFEGETLEQALARYRASCLKRLTVELF